MKNAEMLKIMMPLISVGTIRLREAPDFYDNSHSVDTTTSQCMYKHNYMANTAFLSFPPFSISKLPLFSQSYKLREISYFHWKQVLAIWIVPALLK